MNINDEYLDSVLLEAKNLNASDIHLCTGTQPLFRVNGVLVKDEYSNILTRDNIEYIIDGIIPINKTYILLENKSVDFSFSKDGIGRFRCNIYSQRGSYAIAIRVLPFEILSFEDLGIPNSLKSITSKTKGLFLITGTTGSGKSTTLASIVNLLNEHYGYHILTIEDPIEYIHNHKKSYVTQREIGQDASDFTSALRSALREDPDIIMLGEMRDAETISIALTAAETGHLVLSTLHTASVSKTIDRIIDSFPPEQHSQIRSQLASVLEGVASQQLVRRKDKDGVVLATEIMYTTPAIRNLIREGKNFQINSVLQTGQSLNMHMMEESLASLVKNGIITEDEANIKAFDQQILKQFLQRR